MTKDLISVKEFAEANGLFRQTVFKVIKRLGIEPEKTRGGRQHRGQTISYRCRSVLFVELRAKARSQPFQSWICQQS